MVGLIFNLQDDDILVFSSCNETFCFNIDPEFTK